MGAGSKKEWFMSRIFKNLTALPAGAQGRAVQPVLSQGNKRSSSCQLGSRPVPFTVLGPRTYGEDPACGSRLRQLLFLLRSGFPFKN